LKTPTANSVRSDIVIEKAQPTGKHNTNSKGVLYETETRILKQAVRRNIKRFPEDFMFELTQKEWNKLITNCDMLLNRKFSPALPFAFTEHGTIPKKIGFLNQ